jgi:hypothetical protein
MRVASMLTQALVTNRTLGWRHGRGELHLLRRNVVVISMELWDGGILMALNGAI